MCNTVLANVRVLLCRSAGVQPGMHVGVMLPNVQEHRITHYVVVGLELRAVVLNLNSRLASHAFVDLLGVASHAASVCHVSSAAIVGASCAILPRSSCMYRAGWVGPPCPINLGVIGQTQTYEEALQAGTTAGGPARYGIAIALGGTGIVLAHDVVHCQALARVSEHRMHSDGVWLHAAPMYHLVRAFAICVVTCNGVPVCSYLVHSMQSVCSLCSGRTIQLPHIWLRPWFL